MVIFTEVMANLVKELGATAPVSLTVTEDSIVISTASPAKVTTPKKVASAEPIRTCTGKIDGRIKYYTYNGETLSSIEWAKRYGVSREAILLRFRRHGSPEPLIKTKADKREVK